MQASMSVWPLVVEGLDELLGRAAHVAQVDEEDLASARRNAGWPPGRSSVISVKLPWQRVMPLTGLGTRSIRRWKFSTLRMIRPTPRMGESGGSSGCIASRTPAFSATGTTRAGTTRGFPQRSARTAPAAGGGASRHVPVEARDERAAAAGWRHRRAHPADARHEVIAEHPMPSRPIASQQVAEPRDLLLAALDPEAHPVERRRRLDDGELEPVVGVEPLQQRERHLAPGRVAAQRGGAGRRRRHAARRRQRRRDARDADLRQEPQELFPFGGDELRELDQCTTRTYVARGPCTPRISVFFMLALRLGHRSAAASRPRSSHRL